MRRPMLPLRTPTPITPTSAPATTPPARRSSLAAPGSSNPRQALALRLPIQAVASHARSATSRASRSSYASASSAGSYASGQSGDIPANAGTTWAKKKWFSRALPNALNGPRAGRGVLRTGQSLLAVALGRVVEPPLTPTPPAPFPPQTLAVRTLHARLLSWFLDAPAAPFGVHRMALAGKAAGKDVRMWSGPSTAAGTLRTLVDAFPICDLAVSVAADGTFSQTDVFAASHSPTFSSSSKSSSSHGQGSVSSSSSHGHGRGSTSSSAHSHSSRRKEKDGKEETKRWGDRPVLLLLGIKLGIEGVNPVYYETIKLLYTFPQSAGIAGGRPSSSYYFVGAQGDGLFYLGLHHSRPSVSLRPFLGEPLVSAHGRPSSSSTTSSRPDDRRSLSPEAYVRGGSMSPESGSARGGSMSPDFGFSRGGSMSPDLGHSPITEDELVSSMLIAFVCRDEAKWVNFRRR
ncbi:hypothetical protein B0H16DRAFT_581340 [Mycena metata]|uniref:Cysteine protease n=1 Tax=Mycena metata TaxID=1033252 RepID=A0AAD7MDG4_9AGAR|nr:hypothetical protein B0H16DRAFT_581340 [Mycena metata]